jgi:hypothetical protein
MNSTTLEHAVKASFTVSMPSIVEEERLLSLWTPDSDRSEWSYATTEEVLPESIWRATLPGDIEDAHAVLRSANVVVTNEDFALDAASARLAQLSERLKASGSHEFSGPEAKLITSLRPTEAPEIVQFHVVSGDEEEEVRRTLAWFTGAWNQVRRLFARNSWVETTCGGVLLARTSLSYSGDIVTAWQADITRANGELHGRTVELAVQSRIALLRTLTLALRGAVLLAGIFISPGTALFAIPAVWRFLSDIRKQVATIHADQEGAEHG